MNTDGRCPHASAKYCIIGLRRSLALDLAAYGVRVNAVGPGWTRTQLVQE